MFPCREQSFVFADCDQGKCCLKKSSLICIHLSSRTREHTHSNKHDDDVCIVFVSPFRNYIADSNFMYLFTTIVKSQSPFIYAQWGEHILPSTALKPQWDVCLFCVLLRLGYCQWLDDKHCTHLLLLYTGYRWQQYKKVGRLWAKFDISLKKRRTRKSSKFILQWCNNTRTHTHVGGVHRKNYSLHFCHICRLFSRDRSGHNCDAISACHRTKTTPKSCLILLLSSKGKEWWEKRATAGQHHV